MLAARNLIKEFDIPFYASYDELLKKSDAIDFTVHNDQYFEQVSKAIRLSKHVFLANPYRLRSNELKALDNLLKEADIVAHTGYTERFNPASLTASSYIHNPTFIDTARLVQYSPQNRELSVINDLMIKDIDLVLSYIKSNVKKISANAVSIVNENPDMVSARIEFDNGSIANLTAGRVSEMNIRKARVYQNHSYVFIDFYEKWVKLSAKGNEQIDFEDVIVNPSNEIANHFNAFASGIQHRTESPVSIENAYHASSIASRISEKIKLQTNIFSA